MKTKINNELIRKTSIITLLLVLVILTSCSSTNNPGTQIGTNTQNQQRSISISENGLMANIQPVIGSTISKTINIQINKVPENSRQILLILKPKNLPASENPFAAPNVIAKFLDPLPQQVAIDTQSVENGNYELYIGISSKDSQGWLAESRTNLDVKN